MSSFKLESTSFPVMSESKPSAWTTKNEAIYVPPTEEQLAHNEKMEEDRKATVRFYNSMITKTIYNSNTDIFKNDNVKKMGPILRSKFTRTLNRHMKDVEKDVLESTVRGRIEDAEEHRVHLNELKKINSNFNKCVNGEPIDDSEDEAGSEVDPEVGSKVDPEAEVGAEESETTE